MKGNISSIEKCSNCGSCLNICPVNAIYINKEGLFYKPTVVSELCINCGMCKTVCPLENEMHQNKVCAAYWGWSKNPMTRKNSSSGGAFSALAESILSLGGVVFAAVYDEENQVVIASTDEIPLEKMRKSKYVESLTEDSFRKAKKQLDNGRYVLFCGTPCQIAGLTSFLKYDYENLITCDFACGGLPSHGLFQQYLFTLEEKYNAKVKEVDFRPKTYGWSRHAIKIEFENGCKHIKPAVLDPFFGGFIHENVNTRDCCYECKFAQWHQSDIVLADFWKYGELVGQKIPEKGVSLLLINTPKGMKFVPKILEKMYLEELAVSDASYNLRKKIYSEKHMNLRESYLKKAEEKGLQEAAKVIDLPSGVRKVMIYVKYFLKGAVLRSK